MNRGNNPNAAGSIKRGKYCWSKHNFELVAFHVLFVRNMIRALLLDFMRLWRKFQANPRHILRFSLKGEHRLASFRSPVSFGMTNFLNRELCLIP